MSKTGSQFHNRVINHAINLDTDADQFLSCWREGDWSGCRKFGFEPDIAGAKGSAESTYFKPLNELILEVLRDQPAPFSILSRLNMVRRRQVNNRRLCRRGQFSLTQVI